MGDIIKIKHGNVATIPTLGVGEMAYTNDEEAIYIGSALGNIKFINEAKINARLQHKNILHNWDFRKPINQRAFTGGTIAVNTYFIDRWLCMDNAIKVTINSNSITFANEGASEGGVYQKTEQLLTSGKTYSVSFEVESFSGVISMRLQDTSAWQMVISAPISATGICSANGAILTTAPHRTGLVLSAGASITVKTAKLELGSVSTLANDAPADFGEQLAICQRYALAISDEKNRISTLTNDLVLVTIPTPTTMRLNPSIASGSADIMTIAGTMQSGFTFSYYVRNNVIVVMASKTAHGLTDATLTLDAILSADL